MEEPQGARKMNWGKPGGLGGEGHDPKRTEAGKAYS